MKHKTSILIILFTLLISKPILAAGVFAEIPCFGTGNCTLCDFLYLFILLANWGMGIMGSVALLAFVAGGVMWLISGGNQNLITKGKAILTGTVKGIIIILCAYLIVNTLISTFTGTYFTDNIDKFSTKSGQAKIWSNVCNIQIK